VEFKGPVSFQQAAGHIVHFSEFREGTKKQETAKFKSTVDLRGFTYDRIYAPWRNLLNKPNVYDWQPYTQLERVLRSGGEDDEAEQVYLARRKAERQEIKWKQSKASWFRDCVWWMVANYGILSWNLFLLPLFFILLGVLLFHRPGAVQHSVDDGKHESKRPISYWDSIGLALRTFLPFDVPGKSPWTPTRQRVHLWNRDWIRYSDCTAILKVLGWLYVPLWVAVVAGVFRYVPS
jgi:hypothetical protein